MINCVFCICYCVVCTLISSELSTDIITNIKDVAQLNANVFNSMCLFFCELIIAILVQLTVFLIQKEKHYRYIKISQSVLILLCVISYMFILIFTGTMNENTTQTNSNTNQSDGIRNKFFMNLTNPSNFIVAVPLFNLFNEANHLKLLLKKEEKC